jgi:membrane-associated phospholipid phosphatase
MKGGGPEGPGWPGGARVCGAVVLPPAGFRRELRCALAAVVRRGAAPPPSYVPTWRRLMPWGVPVVGAMLLSMAFLDAPANGLASGLPRWFTDLFEEITDFGRSAWILVPVGVLMALIAVLASRTLDRMSQAVLAATMVRLAFVFTAVAVPGLVTTVVKRWIGRVRPSAQGPFAYEPFSWRPDYASLPSGHATTAFAALVAIGLIFPRVRPALWLYALLIAASRIVVGAHYPSDVIAGAAAGACGALMVRDAFALRRLGFFIAPEGSVHAKPGSSLRRIKRVAGSLTAP